jgi:hypothetical protein
MTCFDELDESQWLAAEGESCTQDSDCCSYECTGGTCAAGPCLVRYRNGYCAVSGCSFADTYAEKACPADSVCNPFFVAGLCQKGCDLQDAATCRGVAGDLWGDYECRASSIGNMCDFGSFWPCSIFATSLQGYDCSIVGLQNNPTNMSCRTLDGQQTSSPSDPNGYCYDDTASGTQYRDPIP